MCGDDFVDHDAQAIGQGFDFRHELPLRRQHARRLVPP
jgi:hypothetical protein